MRVEVNAAKRIAELFNAVRVWDEMANEELEAGNLKKYQRWKANVDENILELADVYGIELPELEFARKRRVKRAA